MFEIGMPVLFAILVWWLGTGVILYLDGLGPRSFGRSMRYASVAAALALLALALTRSSETVAGAYVAFTAAVVLWGWNEMAFLMGYLTGRTARPARPTPGASRASGWRRAR